VRNWVMGSALALAVFAFVLVARAQADNSSVAKADSKSAPFDPHDFSGIWNPVPTMQPKDEPPVTFGRAFTKNDLLPPFTPLGQAKYQANAKFIAAGDVLDCDPYGTARNFFTPRPFEILRTRDRLLQHFEYYDNWREIWTDGRKIPVDADPEYMGYSIGRWDGDTFVVDTVGIDEDSWLDVYGDPHSEELKVEERYTRMDLGYTFPLRDEQLVGGNGGFKLADFRMALDFSPAERLSVSTSVSPCFRVLPEAHAAVGGQGKFVDVARVQGRRATGVGWEVRWAYYAERAGIDHA
jgi:hypothetical protein